MISHQHIMYLSTLSYLLPRECRELWIQVNMDKITLAYYVPVYIKLLFTSKMQRALDLSEYG